MSLEEKRRFEIQKPLTRGEAVCRQGQRLELCCHKPSNIWNHQKLEVSNSLWREKDPADILILYVTRKGLHSPELRENKFLLF